MSIPLSFSFVVIDGSIFNTCSQPTSVIRPAAAGHSKLRTDVKPAATTPLFETSHLTLDT